jgi:hypothetical protein
MTNSKAIDPVNTKEAMLPRRDWIVLPMLGLLTVVLMVGSTEFIARRMFAYSSTGLRDCTVFNDPSTGPRGIPNCVCWEKGYETQPVEYRLNSSGYRADMEFGPKPPDTYRIVMAGSSVAMGYEVENEKTFAVLLPEELSMRTGRRVELLNEAFPGGGGVAALRFNEALAVKPDMILWILGPWDIEHGLETVKHAQKADRSISFMLRAWRRMKLDFAGISFTSATEKIFDGTRTAFLLRHFLYESQSQFVKSYLMGGDEEAGFLKSEPSAEWSDRLRQFDRAARENEKRANTAGVLLVAVLVPNRAQAAMISMGEWPAGYDPYKLGDEVRSIITSHGEIYIDILPSFSRISDPAQYYLPVDGHPDAGGQAILSSLLAKALTGGAVPALRIASQTQLAQDQTR